ncbi:MAG: DUF362 domain-containing protein [Spirochaetaceae bacterium]|jgi:uncharacterized protein (DUF362 family)/Pyruvate/2-oxoacid:ferredoxin oxidoreductase delta subunit|nr:DUF362 domain-containing protein [Spirochaetaceae bacterium]
MNQSTIPANKRVAIIDCADYRQELLYKSLEKAAEFAGGLDVRGKTVLLKPNIVYDSSPEKAIVTHPLFLEAVIRLVKDGGAKRILVGDSPGLQQPGFIAKSSGLGETARRNGAEWVDFTQNKTEIACPDGKMIKHFTVTGAVLEADCIISLPKLKTHQLLHFTGAMKNLFGLIPSVLKSAMHVRLPNRDAFACMLVDLNFALMADYAFMDAVVGMEGPGPGSGTPRKIGLVLASSNLLAIDIAACEIIGYPPARIPVCREALSRGIWLKDISEIEYPAIKPKDVAMPDFQKIPFKSAGNQLAEMIFPRFFRKLRERLTPQPAINPAVCIRCGNCTRICGSSAMSLSGEGKEQHVAIDYQVCIRCYCCHEICPVKAIDIVKPSLWARVMPRRAAGPA